MLIALSAPAALVAAGVPAPAEAAVRKAPARKAPARKPAAKPKKPAPVDPAAEMAVAAEIRAQAGGELKGFYAQRAYRPLWAAGGKLGAAAGTLIGYLQTAEADGLDASRYKPDNLAAAVTAARLGDPREVARAELALSNALARYVRDQRASRAKIIWADPKLKPRKLKPDAVLRAASFPDSLSAYVSEMGWMSPQYVRLRQMAARSSRLSADDRARLRVNLDRARLLPGPYTRHVVVDASSGQLWYYEAGKQVGTMRVVVGAPETKTPLMAGSLQWAILNPYWNVPTYLARDNIAPKVLSGRSLQSMNMQVLSDWSPNARIVPENAVDWQAVARGREEIRLRELPGPANSMGKVKFLFPNGEGIYLHDTPNRDLLAKPERHFSNGCIRLEDAPELGRWLLGNPVRTSAKQVEQAVPLPVSVPVYLTYLTATSTKSGLAFRPDVYGQDG